MQYGGGNLRWFEGLSREDQARLLARDRLAADPHAGEPKRTAEEVLRERARKRDERDRVSS